jgi:hypothetical protein
MDERVLSMHLTDIATPGYTICTRRDAVSIWDNIYSTVLHKRNLFVEFNVERPINRSDEIWLHVVTALKAR